MSATSQTLVLLLAVIAAVAVAAERLKIPPAILLVVTGVALALIPGLPAIEIAPDDTVEIHRRLMFDARFHDTDALIAGMPAAMLDHTSLPAVAAMIQAEIHAGAAVETFVDHLRRATHDPLAYGIALDGVDMDDLIATGASPRGMSMLVRAAKVSAWLDGVADLTPEHLRAVFHEVVAHRVFFTPIYELQRGRLGREFSSALLRAVPAP